MKIILKSLLALILVFAVLFFGSRAWKDFQIEQDKKRLESMNGQILEGAISKPTEITVDFSEQISTGSPLVFGGANTPNIEHRDAWDKIQKVGVTSVRVDFALNWMIKNTTLENYEENIGNIQDINNWNQSELQMMNNKFKEAKNRGMTTIGIIGYTPSWLSYDGTDFGIPKDWDIYEDLVRKIYKYYRSNIDYLEIWNEPDHYKFLTTINTSINKEEAYHLIALHSIKAVREVDNQFNDGKRVPIGGPASNSPRSIKMLNALLKDNYIHNNLDFISYHNYENIEEPSSLYYKKVLTENNKENTPIFITEWNIDGKNDIDNHYKTGNGAIAYTGKILINYLQSGVKAANYYSLQPIKAGSIYLGFYEWENGSANLLPQAKTWNLLSNTMGLGKGDSKIYKTIIEDDQIVSTGFSNYMNEKGVVFVNMGNHPKSINLKLKELDSKNNINLILFHSSQYNDGSSFIYSGTVNTKNNNVSLFLTIPSNSVVGMKINSSNDWYNFLN